MIKCPTFMRVISTCQHHPFDMVKLPAYNDRATLTPRVDQQDDLEAEEAAAAMEAGPSSGTRPRRSSAAGAAAASAAAERFQVQYSCWQTMNLQRS